MRALRAGNRTIAYQCNLVAGDTVFGIKTTFDETFRRYSPGVVLLVDTVSTFTPINGSACTTHALGPTRRLSKTGFPTAAVWSTRCCPSRGFWDWRPLALSTLAE
jgi:hypothetical protein